MSALRRALRPVLRELHLAFLEWALREMDPLHDDLPGIVVRVRHLRAERDGAPA